MSRYTTIQQPADSGYSQPSATSSNASLVHDQPQPSRNEKLYCPESWGRVEDPNLYCPGGFHPVTLGDRLGENGRFRVVAKLGNGAFGIVWLCHDRLIHKWRAVKILAARVSTPTAEIKRHEIPHHRTTALADMVVSKHLAQWYQPDDSILKSHHIGMPLEYFWIHGPNGDHLCHVSPLYGPAIYHLHDLYSPCPSFLKDVCYQLVDSMAFLHQHGLCHGDFRPANILLSLLPGTDEWPEEEIIKLYGEPKTVAVHAVDEEGGWDYEIEPNVPSYLIEAGEFDLGSGACSSNIAVIDFGMAYFLDNPPTVCAIPFKLSSPEGIFSNERIGWPADMWSLACTLLYTATGSYPFGDDDHESTPWLVVEDMERLMGPMPLRYRPLLTTCVSAGRDLTEQQLTDPSRCATFTLPESGASTFKGNSGVIRNRIFVNHMIPWTSAEYEELANQDKTWKKTGRLPKFVRAAGAGGELTWSPSPLHDSEDGEALLDLLLSIFKWEPTERATAKKLLKHPWFENCRSHDGGSRGHLGRIGVTPSIFNAAWILLNGGQAVRQEETWMNRTVRRRVVWILCGLLVGVVSFRLRKSISGM